MTFTSLSFVSFFVLITVIYYICPKKHRWAILLIGSSYFYMAFVPKYIFILFALVLIDFILAKNIEKSVGKRRKLFFIGSIISNIGILFVFKYFNFFSENISAIDKLIHWNYSVGFLKILLPLGLSFHTFQSLSYVIEVYRGKYKAEGHLGIYALYVFFFPQLVAGPIERPEHLLPQLKKEIYFDWSNILSGLRLMAWGFFKKLVVADRLAISVTYIYAHILSVPGLSILITMIFFAIQLYADFSGYSDIARGSAKVLGIDVVRNFAEPYFSTSIAEFWRRWHISLSSWFRDYFYFPLAYSRKKVTRLWLYVCVVLTFLVTGLWHGAGWTFMVMGALYGIYIVFGLITKSWREALIKWVRLDHIPHLHKTLQIIFTFILVSFSWIFFRSPNMQTALTFIRQLFVGWNMSVPQLIQGYILEPFQNLGFGQNEFIISLIGILVIIIVEHIQNKKLWGFFDSKTLLVRSFVYSILIMSIFIFAVSTNQQFIYFQF